MTVRIMQKAQAGATLMEVLIAMSISLVVTASMIGLMSNSLGSTTRIIQMTKLSDDLRVTMQLISRDLRRASYIADAIGTCYGNENCATNSAIAGPITLDASCFAFQLDRDHLGDATDDAPGAFRRSEVVIDTDRDGTPDTSVGVINMWTGTDSSAEPCSAANDDANWVQITNPQHMDITGFSVDEDLSYEQVIRDDGVNDIYKQKVRKIRINMAGNLVQFPTITRQIEDIINVRNDLLLREPQPAP